MCNQAEAMSEAILRLLARDPNAPPHISRFAPGSALAPKAPLPASTIALTTALPPGQGTGLVDDSGAAVGVVNSSSSNSGGGGGGDSASQGRTLAGEGTARALGAEVSRAQLPQVGEGKGEGMVAGAAESGHASQSGRQTPVKGVGVGRASPLPGANSMEVAPEGWEGGGGGRHPPEILHSQELDKEREGVDSLSGRSPSPGKGAKEGGGYRVPQQQHGSRMLTLGRLAVRVGVPAETCRSLVAMDRCWESVRAATLSEHVCCFSGFM